MQDNEDEQEETISPEEVTELLIFIKGCSVSELILFKKFILELRGDHLTTNN